MTDRITPEQRSRLMSRVKGKDTGIELIVRSELHKRGLRFRKHIKKLPGTPDIVFVKKKIAIFIDGDFWHGYRFNRWKKKLTPYWEHKIENNIKRDKSNFAKLHRRGWKVLHIWDHQIKNNLRKQIDKVLIVLEIKNID